MSKKKQSRVSFEASRETIVKAMSELAYLMFANPTDEEIDRLAKQLSVSGRAVAGFDRVVDGKQVIPIEIIIRDKRKATAAEIAENRKREARNASAD